jgi:hypothetical protein
MGVNTDSGIIYFINYRSPAKAAYIIWNHDPHSDELPALRAGSDFAWAFWNREVNRKRTNLRGIMKFMHVDVVNTENGSNHFPSTRATGTRGSLRIPRSGL